MKLLALGLCISCTLLVSQSTAATEIALRAGTAVSVRLADAIDSDHDPFGKQYVASILEPVYIVGGQTIAAGSPATVVLIHTNTGWLTQLTIVTVNGQRFQVASGAGTLLGQQGNKPSPSSGFLGQLAGSSAGTPAVDQRILLPPATELRFLLMGSATPARPVAVPPRPRTSARIEASSSPSSSSSAAPASRAASQLQPRIAYLCRATDTTDRAVPISYYVADVFETSDNPALVERRWRQYLVATYPYRFARNPNATARCTRMTDVAFDRSKLEEQLKSQNAEIVETRWHYILGPPPPAAAAPATTPHP
jgi:hypothetical protein